MATDIQQKSARMNWLLGLLLGSAGCIACVTALLTINYSLPYVSGVIFPDSADAAMRITRQLVTALKTGDREKINILVDDPAPGSPIMNDLALLTNEDVILEYEKLLICETTSEGDVWENVGTLYYNHTSVRFKIELMQAESNAWKVHRFILLPEYGPGANFGWCQ